MFLFEPNAYNETVARLLEDNRQCAVGPGVPNEAARSMLAKTTLSDVVPNAKSREMAACCLSGLWLWHDFLDESHDISQNLDSLEGSYWHGIMHRREPDYSNAKYWYRRVGDHAIYPALLQQASVVAGGSKLDAPAQRLVDAATWDPYAFVDLCADVARGRSNSEAFCREISTLEWQMLFDHCYRQA